MSDDAQSSSAVGGIGLVTVLLALIFLFVWPGPFRYEFRENKDKEVVYKIDRITHQVYGYSSPNDKWMKLGTGELKQ